MAAVTVERLIEAMNKARTAADDEKRRAWIKDELPYKKSLVMYSARQGDSKAHFDAPYYIDVELLREHFPGCGIVQKTDEFGNSFTIIWDPAVVPPEAR